MSNEGVLVGYIEEDWIIPRDPDARIAKWNDDVLARVPTTDDTWPPLIRSMLAAPRIDQPMASFRGRRVISVALHGNYLEKGLVKWLPKFEALLTQLYWLRARLYLEAGWYGEAVLMYDPDEVARSKRLKPDSTPSQTWDFRCVTLSHGPSATHLPGMKDWPRFTFNERYCRPGEAARHDRIRVARMLDAARVAQRTVQGRTRAELDTDDMLFRILARLSDEIASDGQHLGDEARIRIPTVLRGGSHPGRWDDWNKFSLDYVKGDSLWKSKRDELWEYATERLPSFITDVETGLANWPTVDPPSVPQP